MVIYKFPNMKNKSKDKTDYEIPDAILMDDSEFEAGDFFSFFKGGAVQLSLTLRIILGLFSIVLLFLSVVFIPIWFVFRFIDYLLAERNVKVSEAREKYFSFFVFCLVSSLSCSLAAFSPQLGANLIVAYIQIHGLPKIAFLQNLFHVISPE